MNFRHHPDGWIYVDELCLPLDFFLTLEPGYRLPEEATSREYIPGNRHSLFSSHSQWGDNLPWADGDRYLSKRAEYEAAWEAHSNPPPSLVQIKAAKMAELNVQCQATIFSGFSSSALGSPHRYSSKEQDQTNLIGSVTLATTLNLGVSYVCTNGAGLKIGRIHTPAQIKQVFADGASRKQFLIDTFHALEAQVAAAITAAEVAAITWTAT